MQMNREMKIAIALIVSGLALMTALVFVRGGAVIFVLPRDAEALAQYQTQETVKTALAAIGLCLEVAGLALAWRIARRRGA